MGYFRRIFHRRQPIQQRIMMPAPRYMFRPTCAFLPFGGLGFGFGMGSMGLTSSYIEDMEPDDFNCNYMTNDYNNYNGNSGLEAITNSLTPKWANERRSECLATISQAENRLNECLSSSDYKTEEKDEIRKFLKKITDLKAEIRRIEETLTNNPRIMLQRFNQISNELDKIAAEAGKYVGDIKAKLTPSTGGTSEEETIKTEIEKPENQTAVDDVDVRRAKVNDEYKYYDKDGQQITDSAEIEKIQKAFHEKDVKEAMKKDENTVMIDGKTYGKVQLEGEDAPKYYYSNGKEIEDNETNKDLLTKIKNAFAEKDITTQMNKPENKIELDGKIYARATANGTKQYYSIDENGKATPVTDNSVITKLEEAFKSQDAEKAEFDRKFAALPKAIQDEINKTENWFNYEEKVYARATVDGKTHFYNNNLDEITDTALISKLETAFKNKDQDQTPDNDETKLSKTDIKEFCEPLINALMQNNYNLIYGPGSKFLELKDIGENIIHKQYAKKILNAMEIWNNEHQSTYKNKSLINYFATETGGTDGTQKEIFSYILTGFKALADDSAYELNKDTDFMNAYTKASNELANSKILWWDSYDETEVANSIEIMYKKLLAKAKEIKDNEILSNQT